MGELWIDMYNPVFIPHGGYFSFSYNDFHVFQILLRLNQDVQTYFVSLHSH